MGGLRTGAATRFSSVVCTVGRAMVVVRERRLTRRGVVGFMVGSSSKLERGSLEEEETIACLLDGKTEDWWVKGEVI